METMSADPHIARYLEAASSGSIADLKALLAIGVSVNAQSADGETAMHRCAMSGHAEAARFLLNCGIDPDVQDRTQLRYTPFMWACSLNKEEMVALLVPLADHSVVDWKNETAEDKAINHGHANVVSMMRSQKARDVAHGILNSPDLLPFS